MNNIQFHQANNLFSGSFSTRWIQKLFNCDETQGEKAGDKHPNFNSKWESDFECDFSSDADEKVIADINKKKYLLFLRRIVNSSL